MISVIYHAAQGSEICGQYASDAEKAGDQDAAQLFNQVREQNQKLIQQGKDLLKGRL